MIKQKYKIISLLIITFLITFSNLDVFAENSCTDENADSTYDVKFSNPDLNNGTITVTVKQSSFYYEISGTEEKCTGADKSQCIIDKDHPLVYHYDKSTDQNFVVKVTRNFDVADDVCNRCSSRDASGNCVDDTFLRSKVYLINAGSTNKYHNTSRDNNGLCASFVNGTYNSKFQNYGVSRDLFNQFNYANGTKVTTAIKNEYRNRLSYCFTDMVDVNFNDRTVGNMIYSAILSERMRFSSTAGVPLDTTGYTLVSNPEDVQSLKCDPWANRKSLSYEDSLKDENYYLAENTKKYYYTKTDTKTERSGNRTYTCNRTCTEKIKVQYGPPQAAVAGTCFQYKVKVQSKVSCTSTFSGDAPNPNDYKVCSLTASCNGVYGYTDQAGPSEDFDSCVNTCDGGKYSQKCINSCYKKVYGKSIKKSQKMSTSLLAVNFYNKQLDVDVVNIENPSSVCAGINLGEDNKEITRGDTRFAASASNINTIINSYADYDVNGNLVRFKGNGNGHYAWTSDGHIKWVSSTNSSCIFDYLGRGYFNNRNRMVRLITNYAGSDYGRFTGIIGGSDYIIDKSDGFFKARGCRDNCKWLVFDSNGRTYSTKSQIERSGVCRYLNDSDVDSDYQSDLDAYNRALSGCSAQASCQTRDSVFTISVKNKLLKGGINEQSFSATVKSGSSGNSDRTSGDKLAIIKYGGACFGKSSTPEFDYMTEWSVPGSWYSEKHGIEYIKPTRDIARYTVHENEFCISNSSKTVNEKWYKWYVDDNAKSVTQSEKNTIMNGVEYNINATLRKFGYFKWNMNIACYYAYGNASPTIDPTCVGDNCPSPSTCTGDNCPSTTVCTGKKCDQSPTNFEFRNVSTIDLFPNSEFSGSRSSESNRVVGFNWSAAATNLHNQEYQVTPTALIKEIQSRGLSIYDESNRSKYLDYEFNLSRQILKEINKDTKTQHGGKFDDYTGTYSSKNGVRFYRSDLISKLQNKNGVVTKRRNYGCNNVKGNGGCEKFTDDVVRALGGN